MCLKAIKYQASPFPTFEFSPPLKALSPPTFIEKNKKTTKTNRKLIANGKNILCGQNYIKTMGKKQPSKIINQK
jgi:hypothetical protein